MILLIKIMFNFRPISDSYNTFRLSCDACYPPIKIVNDLSISNIYVHKDVCRRFHLNDDNTFFYLSKDYEKVPIDSYSDHKGVILETICPRKHSYVFDDLLSKNPPVPPFYLACTIERTEKKLEISEYMERLEIINNFQLPKELREIIKRIFMISSVWLGGMTRYSIDYIANYCFLSTPWIINNACSCAVSYYKNLVEERGIIMPDKGSGKNGRYLRKDYHALITKDVERVKGMWVVINNYKRFLVSKKGIPQRNIKSLI